MSTLPRMEAAEHVKKNKVVTAAHAASVINDGATVATGGFVGNGFAEEIAIAIEQHFLDTGKPKNLTLMYAAGQGDGKSKGLNHFGQEGMVERVIGGHWGLVPALQKLAVENKIIAYNLPQGVISTMFRDIAAQKPRTISSVGLGTFVDPRNSGGKINTITTEDIVELIDFDGEEYLAYKTRPVDVAVLRGTTADPDGNITMEKEALTLEVLAIAMAARNSGGTIIVQVERVAERGSLHCRDVKIPGILVDYVVVASPENHWQTFGEQYNPSYSGEIRVPMDSLPPLEMSARKIIARRAAFELRRGDIVNLGIGMPEGVSNVVNEEHMLDQIVLTAEPGVIGGVPAGGLSFGAAANTEALIDQPYQFDFYDGGGLDIAYLGMAQADSVGNVNVSKFGPRLAGAGGFINISQNAKTVVYLGTFTAGGLEVAIDDEEIRITKEGKAKKFVEGLVEHITYSGEYGLKKGQRALYITERCVFELTAEGMELIEIAPGIDLQKDILDQMGFHPVINEEPSLMDARIFQDGPMGLAESSGNRVVNLELLVPKEFKEI
ncbi:MAG: acyl CoA:acetate/3-ketoacid CoA transferase [Desulfocapsaceae bacterium]|nr:acyl CoA:acetate/3-ketoacid CoA transferase [Desulfocapsaceae bacterium]